MVRRLRGRFSCHPASDPNLFSPKAVTERLRAPAQSPNRGSSISLKTQEMCDCFPSESVDSSLNKTSWNGISDSEAEDRLKEYGYAIREALPGFARWFNEL